jgi:cell wall-associated NlpC family hydrolase
MFKTPPILVSIFFVFLCIWLSVLNPSISWAYQAPGSYPFPIEHYDQEISHWVDINNLPQQPLISELVQKQQFKNFTDHYIDSKSPWDMDYITSLIKGDLPKVQSDVLDKFDNSKIALDDSKGRGACDTAPYTDQWIQNLRAFANVAQFAGKNYDVNQRAITIKNTYARALPTEDRYFHNCNLPGEGDSFDYLQVSAIWAGTPLYILGKSTDHKWDFVSTTDFTAWVKSEDVATVSDEFVTTWKNAAHNKIIAINSPINIKLLSIQDEETQAPLFSGYIGAIFPLFKEEDNGFHILVPVRDANNQAQIHHAFLSKEDAVTVPLIATTSNFISVIKNLVGMPYGWGGWNVANSTEFTYDCSAELKALYAQFGIWLPRNSAQQVNTEMMLGTVKDFTKNTTDDRINNLTQKDANDNDHRFTSIVNISGHIFMYLGNYQDPNTAQSEALTFQNVWGLRPVIGDGRYVIGKAVLFPLLAKYPEQFPDSSRELSSLASKPAFTIAYLDELPLVQPLELWSRLKRHRPMSLDELRGLTLVLPPSH